jgi:hypothetical protein
MKARTLLSSRYIKNISRTTNIHFFAATLVTVDNSGIWCEGHLSANSAISPPSVSGGSGIASCTTGLCAAEGIVGGILGGLKQ